MVGIVESFFLGNSFFDNGIVIMDKVIMLVIVGGISVIVFYFCVISEVNVVDFSRGGFGYCDGCYGEGCMSCES